MSEHTLAVNDATFDRDVLKASVPVLVDFWAPWCGPCVSIAPTLEGIAAEYKGRAIIAKLNVDENASIPTTYGVRSIPFLALFKDGQVVDSVVGAVPKSRLTDMLNKQVAAE